MSSKPSLLAVAGLLLPLLAGCHHHPKQARHAPPPTLRAPTAPPATVAERLPSSIPVEPRTPGQTRTPGLTTAADLAFVRSHTPVFAETGTASWYGPPYNRRRGANGQVFDQDALTAAHRTLPMNSLIRVTNLSNGKSAIMHVTDRGPFVPGRVLDLS
ncbi:MAG: septal ring lytic transglycosylase RlpA family protein, partial [Acidobacteriaceae bacterium]